MVDSGLALAENSAKQQVTGHTEHTLKEKAVLEGQVNIMGAVKDCAQGQSEHNERSCYCSIYNFFSSTQAERHNINSSKLH